MHVYAALAAVGGDARASFSVASCRCTRSLQRGTLAACLVGFYGARAYCEAGDDKLGGSARITTELYCWKSLYDLRL